MAVSDRIISRGAARQATDFFLYLNSELEEVPAPDNLEGGQDNPADVNMGHQYVARHLPAHTCQQRVKKDKCF